MRRWFVYGLCALYEYWLSCCYVILWFIIVQYQFTNDSNTVHPFNLYICMSIAWYHFRLSFHSKMKIIISDSG